MVLVLLKAIGIPHIQLCSKFWGTVYGSRGIFADRTDGGQCMRLFLKIVSMNDTSLILSLRWVLSAGRHVEDVARPLSQGMA